MAQPNDYLLVSDLDDTLLGDEVALEGFVAFRKSLGERVRLHLVYASGRFYESIRRDINETPLPEPLAVIGGVGSEMRRFPDGTFIEEWRERMSGNWSAERVTEILSGEAGLVLQPAADQSEFKVSFYAENASQAQLQAWQCKLRDAGIGSRLIYSSGRDLDFLPEGVDKGTAAVFVAGLLGFPMERVMVSGNSANDSALFDHGFHGIVVGNAHPELKAYAQRDNVYLSPQAIAAGVQDGIRHWLKLD